MNTRIKIKQPGINCKKVAPGASILVMGEIFATTPLKKNTVFKCELFDENNKLLRYSYTNTKNDKRIISKKEGLLLYPEKIDKNKKEYLDAGFCEMLCLDLNKPDDSFKNATIKAFYNDHKFRALLYSASDIKHGAIFDDGLNFKNENGKPYKALPIGKYKVRVSLSEDNNLICEDISYFEITYFENAVLCRFNPLSHKANMMRWAKKIKVDIDTDDYPGYLAPYHNNLWLYHMGYLPFYRSNDICMYQKAKAFMFVYMMAEDSTSYATELAYLMKENVVDNKKRFEAFCYDIGEANVGKRKGKIIPFEDKYMHIYRIDAVNENAKENFYDLSGNGVKKSLYKNYRIKANSKIGITGVCKPYQLSQKDFILKKDNEYKIKNRMDKVGYKFFNGDKEYLFTKELNMERFDEKPLEKSVYEFYNLFELDDRFTKGKWNVDINVYDLKGNVTPCKETIEIEII